MQIGRPREQYKALKTDKPSFSFGLDAGPVPPEVSSTHPRVCVHGHVQIVLLLSCLITADSAITAGWGHNIAEQPLSTYKQQSDSHAIRCDNALRILVHLFVVACWVEGYTRHEDIM
jgi:hypothetical protein